MTHSLEMLAISAKLLARASAELRDDLRSHEGDSIVVAHLTTVRLLLAVASDHIAAMAKQEADAEKRRAVGAQP